jgi:coenzyme F420-reducing hydrogenase delta subunit
MNESERGTMQPPAILILATSTCAYPAADAVGQAHLSYAANTYIVSTPSPVVFPADFYVRCLEKGFGGILVMVCGHECPYAGAFEKLAARLDEVRLVLRERGIDPQRLSMKAVCTVCSESYLGAIDEMNQLLTANAGGADD